MRPRELESCKGQVEGNSWIVFMYVERMKIEGIGMGFGGLFAADSRGGFQGQNGNCCYRTMCVFV